MNITECGFQMPAGCISNKNFFRNWGSSDNIKDWPKSLESHSKHSLMKWSMLKVNGIQIPILSKMMIQVKSFVRHPIVCYEIRSKYNLD